MDNIGIEMMGADGAVAANAEGVEGAQGAADTAGVADTTADAPGDRVETTTFRGFPKYRLDAAREALAAAHKRMVRAAARTGQTAPAAPELVVLAERVESKCTECGGVTSGFAGGRCPGCRKGHLVSREVVDLQITTARPRLAGWELLAVVEPLEGGNLLRQVPGAQVADGELDAWRAGAPACDHCGKIRRRLETFIVRATGEDPAVASGTYRQVGRNCLAAFLGGASPASIVASIGWRDLVRAAGDDGEGGWGGGAANRAHDPADFLAWVAAVIRIDGWVSRGAARAARDDSKPLRATADIALYLVTPPWGGGNARDAWHRDVETYQPTAEDRARADAALAWARELVPATATAPASDYERNLALVARQTVLRPEHAGILASAVAAHTRALGRDVERRQRAARNAVSRYVGAIGERLELELDAERVIETSTDWGAMNILIMRDAAGNVLVWKTGAATAQPGDRLRIKGTVKRHAEYRPKGLPGGDPGGGAGADPGAAPIPPVLQTELTRCKILERTRAV